ncbi:hypothetical protein L596_023717 [Steinernema carpocapsae]|uniref:Hexosyltransferase n=1 Tax=Steinernema carpocapsae TaxID=34508 RepID=A0A4U5MEH4_STECR|nr:hypothetical protein L596_023717 [Steinernema carpocapsae]
MSAMRLFNPEPPRPCDENTDFLVTVISNSNETKQREDVRRTWASEANRNTTTKVVFIVARPKAGNYGREFWAEADKYDDIVMANFRDDYHNLSMKSYSALKYHLNYCPQARCLLKIDTDVVANLRGLENLCRRNGDSPLITGNGWTTGGWGTSFATTAASTTSRSSCTTPRTLRTSAVPATSSAAAASVRCS